MDRLILAVLAGLVCGALGGIVAVVLQPAEEPALAPEPDAPAAESTGEGSASPDEVRPRGGRRVRTTAADKLGLALSSPDVAVRHAALREVMSAGRRGLRRLERASPPTADGQRLVALAHPALDDLVRNREHPSYARLPEVSRLELELRALASVLPEDELRPERAAYWSARVDALERLEAAGGGHPGELALARIERDRVRLERGEVTADAWRELATSGRADVDAWITSLAERRDVPPSRVAELRERVAGIDRRLGELDPR